MKKLDLERLISDFLLWLFLRAVDGLPYSVIAWYMVIAMKAHDQYLLDTNTKYFSPYRDTYEILGLFLGILFVMHLIGSIIDGKYFSPASELIEYIKKKIQPYYED